MKLLDKNSNPNPREKNINPLLTIHEYAESGDLVGLHRLLCSNPSLLNDRSHLMSQTALHIAASLNRIEIAKHLIEWSGPGKVDLEAKNVYGETPVHLASKNGCNETLRMLLNSGANIEARTTHSTTPLHLAIGYALRTGDNSVVKTLSDYKADFYARDNEGMTPYNYIPAGMNNVELLTILCQNVKEQIENITQQMYNTTGLSGQGYQNVTPQLYNALGVPGQGYGNLAPMYSSLGLSGQGYENAVAQMYSTLGLSGQGCQNVVGGQSSNGYSSTSYTNVGDSMSYESGIKGKMEEFNNELSKIVGLHELKQQLQKWAKGMLLDEKRRAMGLNLGARKPPHMAFLGNPGTGKTTVARILGKLLLSVGVLSSDKVVEVQRTDLVGEYIGQTGPKTRKKIEEAMGGILFVDEAYRLAVQTKSGDTTDLGVEALEEIMSVLEDGNLVLIFAGYTEPMKRVFSTNEGFSRRVTHFFQFDDYTCKDLAEMVMLKMSKLDEKSRLYGFKFHPSCTYATILSLIERHTTEKLRRKMNGGLVDHMLNNARENLDSRLSFDSKGDELLTITMADLEAGLKMVSSRVAVD